MKKKYINSETFIVSVVCREDLEEYIGKKAYKISDKDMELIADEMGDIFSDCGYWEALDYALDRRSYYK